VVQQIPLSRQEEISDRVFAAEIDPNVPETVIQKLTQAGALRSQQAISYWLAGHTAEMPKWAWSFAASCWAKGFFKKYQPYLEGLSSSVLPDWSNQSHFVIRAPWSDLLFLSDEATKKR
jgi:hypothetical protein